MEDVEILKAAKSFSIFNKVFLKKFFFLPPATFHSDIIKNLEDEKVKRYAVACPRSYGKSTIFSVAFPLWQAYTENYSRIILISATDKLSIQWLWTIRNEIESNPYFKAIYDNIKGDIWQDDWITLKNGGWIRALGRGCQVRGFRPTCVIADDLEDERSFRSETARNRIKEWFYTSLINTLEPACKIVVCGTILGRQSLLQELIEEPYTKKPREGWIGAVYDCYDGNDNSTWPEKWPNHELEKRKLEIGVKAFYTEYRNKPLPAEMTIFKPEMVQFYEKDEIKLGDNWTIIMAVDPAFSTSVEANYTGIVILGSDNTDESRKIRVIRAVNKRLNTNELVNEIFSLAEEYKPTYICVEFHATQKVLEPILVQEALRRNKAMPLVKVHADKDKRRRALSISHFLEQKRVWFFKGEANQRELVEQILTFPECKYDDLFDAFVYALRTYQLVLMDVVDKKKVSEEEQILNKKLESDDEKYYDTTLGEYF